MKAGDVVECIEMDEDDCKANKVTLGKRYKVASSEDEDCDNELVFLVEDDAGLNNCHRGVYAYRFKLVSRPTLDTRASTAQGVTRWLLSLAFALYFLAHALLGQASTKTGKKEE